MEIYLVGGAVRDKLLGLPVKEKDWVVVHATIKEMLEQGFKPVGQNFPVFLHPQTHEEYALARTERKVGKGYKGFTFYTDPSVTLEEDLKRRDLTINAIAEKADGSLVDPFQGKADLQKSILRHVSEAFSEDPVRILRVARFAARFDNFHIHPTTMKLMQKMVHAHEVEALVPERVWQEFARALQESSPWRFFEVLKECGALPILFFQLDPHYSAIITTLKAITTISPDPVIRFAAMTHKLPITALKTLCSQNRTPASYHKLAKLVNKNHLLLTELSNAEKILSLLEKVDAFRRPQRFKAFLLACQAITPNLITTKQKARIIKALAKAKSVSITPTIRDKSGEEIKKTIHTKRLQAIKELP